MAESIIQSKSTIVAVGYACAIMNFFMLPIIFTVVGIFTGLICLFSTKIAHGLLIIIMCIITGCVGASIGGWGLGLPKFALNSTFDIKTKTHENFVGNWVCVAANIEKKEDYYDYDHLIGQTNHINIQPDEKDKNGNEFYFFSGEGGLYFIKNDTTLQTADDNCELIYNITNKHLTLNEKKPKIEMEFSKSNESN